MKENLPEKISRSTVPFVFPLNVDLVPDLAERSFSNGRLSMNSNGEFLHTPKVTLN